MIKFGRPQGFAQSGFVSATWIDGELFFSIYKNDPLVLDPLEACVYLGRDDFYEMLELVDLALEQGLANQQ